MLPGQPGLMASQRDFTLVMPLPYEESWRQPVLESLSRSLHLHESEAHALVGERSSKVTDSK